MSPLSSFLSIPSFCEFETLDSVCSSSTWVSTSVFLSSLPGPLGSGCLSLSLFLAPPADVAVLINIGLPLSLHEGSGQCFRVGCLLPVTKNLTSRLSQLIELLQSSDLHECVRTIVTALVTLLIGQLRQIKDLHQDCWKGCLRYYPTDTSISVKCGETTLEYDLSTTTNQQVERLVQTDVTFSAYYQAMQAMGPAGNGIVHGEGPSGTGKTETFKDLAKELGMKCTVIKSETHTNS